MRMECLSERREWGEAMRRDAEGLFQQYYLEEGVEDATAGAGEMAAEGMSTNKIIIFVLPITLDMPWLMYVL